MAPVLCQLKDLDATGAKEIVLDQNGARVPIFVVKFGDHVLGYENSCPHVRLPLNWKEDSFFDVSHTFLFCANHGAHFDVMVAYACAAPAKAKA